MKKLSKEILEDYIQENMIHIRNGRGIGRDYMSVNLWGKRIESSEFDDLFDKAWNYIKKMSQKSENK